ncbi:hypothetical protein JTE90_018582 [Oedothorax gibbosus]|uniref:Endoplasmic reticulum junction formation protein lunapark n=1 Tax=Oedothorax gibbosus TaxID=931172 RepID=A0AAV6U4E0_9ARAC|nr:hypothetical protein JTE90_018582 [Oedothorax gibbosus]
MGGLFSRFRAKPTTKELLEDLQKEIEVLEEYKRSTEVQQKAVVRSLIFYSVLLYIIIAGVFLFYNYPVTTKDRVIYAVPFLIFPLLLYILKKFLQWYFLQKIRNNDENLLELRKRKKSLLEFAMETETYKVVKELLEKYDQAQHKRIFEAKPAIEAAPTPLKGSFADMDLRRRSVSPRQTSPTALGTPGQTLTFNSSAGSPHFYPPRTNPPYPPAFYQRGAQQFVRPPAPPMPRPVLPRERTLVDRLVDYLVGDGPSNRYALICRQCQSHNGMALKEEFEYVAFRCCYCFQFNPPRNQQPPPPRLTLPAPPPSAPPAITEGPGSELSTSSEEAEIESVSDVDNSASALQPEEKSEESEIHEESTENDPLHRLSISSEASEIQANLVEDRPYQSPEPKETEEENYNAAEAGS